MNKKIMTKENFLDAIDNLDIFAKDYNTISTLMKNLDDRLFIRILEEVLNGNLFWADFESVLADTEYVEFLKTNIPAQKKMYRDINQLSLLRSELGFDENNKRTNMGISYASFSDENKENYILMLDILKNNMNLLDDTTLSNELKALKSTVLSDINKGEVSSKSLTNFRRKLVEYNNTLNDNNKIQNLDIILTSIDEGVVFSDIKEDATFYKNEYDNLRNMHLYNLTKFNPNDSVLTRLCKKRLYNAIMNGNLLNECSIVYNDELGVNEIIKDGKVIGNLTTDYNIVDVNTDASTGHEYINVNDILLSIDNGIVPIAYEYQELDPTDLEFMRRYQISDTKMKQIKSLNMFLRRQDFIQKYKED